MFTLHQSHLYFPRYYYLITLDTSEPFYHSDILPWILICVYKNLIPHIPELNTIMGYKLFMDCVDLFAHSRLKKAYDLSGDENLLLGRNLQLFAVPVSATGFCPPCSAMFRLLITFRYFVGLLCQVSPPPANLTWMILNTPVLDSIPSLRTVIILSTTSMPFTLSTIAIYTVLALVYPVTPRAVYKSLRVWGFMDAECPFPSCAGTTPAQVYHFPHGWYDHVTRQHANGSAQRVRATSSSIASANSLGHSNSSILTSFTSVAPAQDTSNSGNIFSTPVIAGDGSQPVTKLSTTTSRVLDLCLPDYPADVLRQWKDMDFNTSCSDESLCRDFAKAYFTQRSKSVGRIGQRITESLLSWLSFTHLGIVQPVKVSILIYPRHEDCCAN